MAASDKKKMNAELNMSPYAEMNRKTAEWVKSIPALDKVCKPVQYSEFTELDKRK